MKIRRAHHHEQSDILRLREEAYREYESIIGPGNWRTMRRGLTNTDGAAAKGVWLVVESSGVLAATVVHVPPGQSDGVIFPVDWASIRALAVHPSFRGEGLGRRLVEECLRRARRDRAEVIGLHTSPTMMPRALAVYERLGFTKDIDLPSRYGVIYARYKIELDARSRPASRNHRPARSHRRQSSRSASTEAKTAVRCRLGSLK